jgi:hypothetical protein
LRTRETPNRHSGTVEPDGKKASVDGELRATGVALAAQAERSNAMKDTPINNENSLFFTFFLFRLSEDKASWLVYLGNLEFIRTRTYSLSIFISKATPRSELHKAFLQQK